MIKAEVTMDRDFDVFMKNLNATLAFICREHGDSCVVSVSHSAPNGITEKFIGVITYKAKY